MERNGPLFSNGGRSGNGVRGRVCDDGEVVLGVGRLGVIQNFLKFSRPVSEVAALVCLQVALMLSAMSIFSALKMLPTITRALGGTRGVGVAQKHALVTSLYIYSREIRLV